MAYINKADRIKIQEKAAEIVNAEKTGPEPIVVPAIGVKRDWNNKDPWKVPKAVLKKYPNMAFQWVLRTVDTVNRMEEYEDKGWAYPRLTKEERDIDRPGGFDTTFITKGDTVLMMLPKEDYADFIKQRDALVINRNKLIQNRQGIRAQMEQHHELGATFKEDVQIENKNEM